MTNEKTTLADLTEDYLLLDKTGEIKTLAGGAAFWSLPPEEIESIGEDWFISEFVFDEDWKTWEMHPHGEEVVYMLSGAMDLTLEKDGGDDGERRTVELRGKGLVVVPRGTWHTARVLEKSSVLVMTLGKETQIRAVE